MQGVRDKSLTKSQLDRLEAAWQGHQRICAQYHCPTIPIDDFIREWKTVLEAERLEQSDVFDYRAYKREARNYSRVYSKPIDAGWAEKNANERA